MQYWVILVLQQPGKGGGGRRLTNIALGGFAVAAICWLKQL